MNKKAIIFIILIVLAAATAIFIFSNSLQSGEMSMAESASVIEWLRPIIDPAGRLSTEKLQFIVRKTAHFAEYFLLGLELSVITLTISKKIFTPWLFMPLFLILFTAVIDEFIQSFTGRTSLLSDVLLDFFGGVCALFFFICIYALISAVKKKKNKPRITETL